MNTIKINVIKKNISEYKNQYIQDTTLLRYVGFKTYASLYKNDKNLYQYFSECEKYLNKNTQLDLDLIDLNLTSIEIKTQILAKILKDDNYIISDYIKDLIYDKQINIYTKDNNYDIIIFIIIMFIFIFFIVFFLYKSGFLKYIFSKNCTTDSCIIYYDNL